ncbi:hypothetical protein ACFWN7_01955 [Agromyces sp. NPDC058484]|uniref:hypothetical protein n=1 Tax=Agromyces sp. NPDC058484 TaxID=3346524 RepID=UPI00365CEA66
MVQPLLWSDLDALFRNARLNFGYAPGNVPTIRVECELADGRRIASYFSFETTVGEMVGEMGALVQASTEVPDAG